MTYVEFIITAVVFFLLGLCSAAVLLSRMVEIYQDERYQLMAKDDLDPIV